MFCSRVYLGTLWLLPLWYSWWLCLGLWLLLGHLMKLLWMKMKLLIGKKDQNLAWYELCRELMIKFLLSCWLSVKWTLFFNAMQNTFTAVRIWWICESKKLFCLQKTIKFNNQRIFIICAKTLCYSFLSFFNCFCAKLIFNVFLYII